MRTSKCSEEQIIGLLRPGHEEGGADFAEYLHLGLAQHGRELPFWTFDAKGLMAPGAGLRPYATCKLKRFWV